MKPDYRRCGMGTLAAAEGGCASGAAFGWLGRTVSKFRATHAVADCPRSRCRHAAALFEESP